MDKIHIFRVRYGEACQTVLAPSSAAAVEVVRNEYDAEWGESAFDLYDVEVEDDGENNSAYPVSLPTAQ